MTDRVRTLTVVLDQDVRVDDVQVIVQTLRSIRHVVHVTPNVLNSAEQLARTTARLELRKDLYEALDRVLKI